MITRFVAASAATLGILAWSAVPAQAEAQLDGATVAIKLQSHALYLTADPEATYYGHTYTLPMRPGYASQRWQIEAHPSGTGWAVRNVDFDECLTEVTSAVGGFVSTSACSGNTIQAWTIDDSGGTLQLISTRFDNVCVTGNDSGRYVGLLRCGYPNYGHLQEFTLVTL